MTQELRVWSWRQAIAKASIESGTKLILYTLSNYMNEMGQGCYPTIDTLVLESGMARATVVKYLEEAKKAGFLAVRKHGFGGQKWARNEYTARYPANAMLAHNPEENGQEKGGSQNELPLPEAVQPATKGGSTDEKKAVQQLNTNSPLNTPENSPISDDKSSGDASPIDFKEIVFSAGLNYMKRHSGMKEPSIRQLLGKWCRDYGDPQVAAAITSAAGLSAVDPVSFIESHLKKGGKNGKGHTKSKHDLSGNGNQLSASDGFEFA